MSHFPSLHNPNYGSTLCRVSLSPEPTSSIMTRYKRAIQGTDRLHSSEEANRNTACRDTPSPSLKSISLRGSSEVINIEKCNCIVPAIHLVNNVNVARAVYYISTLGSSQNMPPLAQRHPSHPAPSPTPSANLSLLQNQSPLQSRNQTSQPILHFLSPPRSQKENPPRSQNQSPPRSQDENLPL